ETKDAKSEKEVEKEAELSEEDRQMQEELEMLVTRLKEPLVSLYIPALESLRTMIRSATTSMTSVPKPLKFLRQHYDSLKAIYETMPSDEAKRFTADIISILSMTMPPEKYGIGDTLKYRLKGSREDIGSWGHEYVRHIAGEIAYEWQSDGIDNNYKETLLDLVKEIIPYQMRHNAEAEAADLLMEIERLDLLEQYIDNEDVCLRVCLYLTSCVPFVPDPENTNLLKTALKIFLKFEKYPEALRLAMQLGDVKEIEEVVKQCTDPSMQKQLSFMLGRQQVMLEDVLDTDCLDIMSNTHLNNHFLALARELDILEAKTPDDIYKTHLENSSRSYSGNVDSARANLSSSFVNGFVNCGFGKDKLLLVEDGSKWLYKNKDHGMLSATASLGLILLWDVDSGLTQIDKYLYSSEDNIKAGALLACGLVNCGVRNDCDPALALLGDYVNHNSVPLRIGAIIGLGLAYAGSNRSDVISTLLPVLTDSKQSMEVIGITAVSCGLIAVGSTNSEVTANCLQVLLEKDADSKVDLKSEPFAKFLSLAIGLCYLGKQEGAETIQAALDVITNEPFKAMSKTLLDICAYAATGNVLKIQHLLHICSEKHETKEGDEDWDKHGTNRSLQQAVATIGIALIAMAEDIGSEMAFRSFGHLLRYGDLVIKRAVPLSLALISISNPKLNILETLSKFSHDSDTEVACNAIFAMGLIGAGTNNARLATMLRQLAQFHSKEANALFMTRIAQGLTHLGKGTLTLSPFHSDRQLMVPTAVAGLLIVLISLLDVKSTILSKSHYLLFYLTSAIQPRMLVTFDEDLKPLPVPVRVGQAVDVVGQAGKPKTITGFQTHTTPVLLALGERAELATEEYVALTPILEAKAFPRQPRTCGSVSGLLVSMRLYISWKCFAFLCLALNVALTVLIFSSLEKQCVNVSDATAKHRWLSQQRKAHEFNEQNLRKLLSIVIVEFEEFENELSETIDSVCGKFIDADVFIISQHTIYPPISVPKRVHNLCSVHFVSTASNPQKSFNETRPETLLKAEYLMFVFDGTRIPSDLHLNSLKFKHLNDKNIVAIPVVSEISDDFYSCLKVAVDLKRWTIQYSESKDQQQCDALIGNFAFLMKTSTFLKLNSPFERPFQVSLFIQSKLRDFSILIDEDTKFVRTNDLFLDEHKKWKKDAFYSQRLSQLYKNFGIKRVIQVNGDIEWYGCHKKSRRCFPTVIDDMPNYLFEGKWTPPCCLHNLRITARHVFDILEKSQVRYWLEGGSLLGASRNGDIIPWDYDVDIGIYKEDIEKCSLLREAMKHHVKDQQGFIWEKAVEGDFFRVQFSETNRLHVDIFPFYSKNGMMTKDTWFDNHPQDKEFPEHYLKPLKRIKFVGWNAFIPNNHIEFLEMKFGKGVITNFQYPVPSKLNFSDH
ncbi:26S proteasome non-ATPase regulatory subunit 2-like protein, partial [Dinothrombium tinctorium]